MSADMIPNITGTISMLKFLKAYLGVICVAQFLKHADNLNFNSYVSLEQQKRRKILKNVFKTNKGITSE